MLHVCHWIHKAAVRKERWGQRGQARCWDLAISPRFTRSYMFFSYISQKPLILKSEEYNFLKNGFKPLMIAEKSWKTWVGWNPQGEKPTAHPKTFLPWNHSCILKRILIRSWGNSPKLVNGPATLDPRQTGKGHTCSLPLSLHSGSETLFTFFCFPCTLALFYTSGKSQIAQEPTSTIFRLVFTSED